MEVISLDHPGVDEALAPGIQFEVEHPPHLEGAMVIASGHLINDSDDETWVYLFSPYFSLEHRPHHELLFTGPPAAPGPPSPPPRPLPPRRFLLPAKSRYRFEDRMDLTHYQWPPGLELRLIVRFHFTAIEIIQEYTLELPPG